MTMTAEIVTFRLIEGSDTTAFRRAAADMEPLLRDAGGMIRRTLSVDADGLWTDHILWSSMDTAQAAAQQIMANPAAAPFMQMIDEPTAQMRHAMVQIQQE